MSTSSGGAPFEELVRDPPAFAAARDWGQFHDPKNLAMLVASEAGELVAEYRWVRGDEADAHSSGPEARARIAAEIADKHKLARNPGRYPVEAPRGKAERP